MKLSELVSVANELNLNDPYILSDSGWECGETDCNAIWYSKKLNILILTQGDEFGHDSKEEYKHLFDDEKENDFETVEFKRREGRIN